MYVSMGKPHPNWLVSVVSRSRISHGTVILSEFITLCFCTQTELIWWWLTCHSCWVPRCCRQCHASVDVISCRCGYRLLCWMNRHTGQTTASDPVACFLLKHVPRRHAYSEISCQSQIAIFSRQTYTQSVVLVVITWHFVCCWHWHRQLQTYLFSSY